MGNADILLESGTNELEILEFFIVEGTGGNGVSRSHFGVNVAKVLEVIENPGLAPGRSAADPCFLGTISLRGKSLPVIDLCVWLGLERVRRDQEIILVTEFNRKVTGFLVSGVARIHRISWREVEAPGKLITRGRTSCITGLVHFPDRIVLMLDLESILAGFDPDFGGASSQPVPAADRTYTALVADDSRAMRELLSGCLTRANFTVRLAENGEEAWTILRRAGDAGRDRPDGVDVVISDIEMPLLDGLALTKRIRADQNLKDIPVILFSSLITDAQRHKGESVGADLQISKPEFAELAREAIRLIAGRAPA